MYGEIYNIPFQSINNVNYKIVIEKDGFIGTTTELQGAESPFTVVTELETPLSPYRLSTATLKIFGGDYLQNLFTSNPQGVRVKLLKENQIEWLGFITNDTYSQDYSTVEFEYEIELVNPLSTLKYKKFVRSSDTITFLQLIQDAIKKTNSEIKYLYLSSSITDSVNANIYKLVYTSSDNYIDEQDEEMTYYDILEEIAKYLGLTITYDKDSVYLIDYIGIKNNYNEYYKYTFNTDGTITENVATVPLSNTKTVQQIEYAGDASSLSINSGKNKAKVTCSLYDIDDIISEFSDKGSIYVDMKTEFVDYTQSKINSEYGAIIRYYKQPNYTFWNYTDGDPTKPFISIDPIVGNINNPILSGNTGTSFVRTADWSLEEIPPKLSLTTELQVKRTRDYNEAMAGKILTSNHKIFSMKSSKRVIINKNVWFAISLSLKRMFEDWTKYDATMKASEDYTINQPAQFRIGNYYYDGTTWTTNSAAKFNMPIEIKKGDKTLNTYYSLKNTNTFDKGIGDILGYTFKAPDFTIVGDVELTLFSIDTIVYFTATTPRRVDKFHYYTDIEVAYGIPNEESVYEDWKDKDSDLVYENEVSDEFVEELKEEVELKICTFPDNYNKLCYSTTFVNNEFLKTLKYKPLNLTDKPEVILINKIIEYYKLPKYQVTIPLNNSVIYPYTLITDSNLAGKVFIYAGNEIDYEFERNKINLIEI